MAQTLKKLNWEPMHDTVYPSIRDAIMGAQFEPGQKLSLRAITGELRVSVMPVRAAVLRLVAEKALEQARHGTFSLPWLSQTSFARSWSYAWYWKGGRHLLPRTP